MKYRPITAADLVYVPRLYVAEHPEADLMTVGTQMLAELQNPAWHAVIFQQGTTKVQGYASGRLLMLGAKVLVFEDYALATPFRKDAILRALLDALIAWGRAEGATAVIVPVADERQQRIAKLIGAEAETVLYRLALPSEAQIAVG